MKNEEDPLEGFTPEQRVDIGKYTIENHPKGSWIGAFFAMSGKKKAFALVCAGFIEEMCRWAATEWL